MHRGETFSSPATCPDCRRGLLEGRASWERDPVSAVTPGCASSGWEPWRTMLRPGLRALAALAARRQKEFRTLLERETAIEAQADGPEGH